MNMTMKCPCCSASLVLGPMECDRCDRVFETENDLKQHYRSAHGLALRDLPRPWLVEESRNG